MAQNLYSLQLLRNGSPFTSYAAAVNAITGGTEQDGVLKLARYTDSNSEDQKYRTNSIKTIFGIRHSISGATGGTGWTIFDSYTEVIKNLQDQINAMGGESGSIAQQIQTALDALDYTSATGNVITQVTQTNGLVAATGANVGTLELTGYDEGTASGHVEANDSINAAIAKLQNQIDAANEAKNAAIEALDGSITAETGYYINKVDEVDGKISGTTVALPSVLQISSEGQAITAVSQSLGTVAASYGDIAAAHVTVADASNNFSSTTVEATLAEIVDKYKAADAALKTEILGGASASADTLGELETLINNLGADAATYTVKKVTTGLATNVKEQYVLVETKNGESTDKEVAIPIYKDNTLKSVELVDQALQFTYIVDSGESVVSVDVSKFLAESEFASGITVNSNGVAHGVVDPTSETFLTVGADGFKLAGVQDAIDAASSDVKNKLDELSGKTVTAVEMTGGTATIADNSTDGTKKITINADGSTLKTSTAYTSAQTASAVAANDSIDTALGKLEAQVAAAKAAATTKVVEGTDAGNNLEIVSTTGADQSVTYTINLTDVASASALTAEIAARKAVDGQNGQTYAANTSSNFINGATSLNDADVKLDTELKKVEDKIGLVNGEYQAPASGYASGASTVTEAINQLNEQAMKNTIVAGDGITVSEAAEGTTVAVKLRGTTDNVENPLKFNDNGELYCDYLDCGTY